METKILNFIGVKKQSRDEVFIENVEKYKINLYRLAKSIVKNDTDTEDAVSETILKAYSNLNQLRSFNKFKPWIMQILVNECYRLCNLRNKTIYSDDMEEYIKSTYEENEDNGGMWNLVNTLEEDFRIVSVLFYYEDLSLKDISKILDIPIGTVKSRLSRARQKLKILVEEKEEI